MKTASIQELKPAINSLSKPAIADLCLKLARFKKENKELLTYLLFEADNESSYIISVKDDIDESFSALTYSNLYLTKKSLRKILRAINKYIRFSGSKTVEVELRIYFCDAIKTAKIPIRKSTALSNLYDGEIKKINLAIATFHEDLQYDYLKEVEKLI